MMSMRAESQFSGPPNEAATEFADFYAETMPSTLRTIRRLSGELEVARDATQEAYARMLKAWPQRRWCSPEANRRYTVAIANNQVKDWFRRRKRLTTLEDHHDSGVDELGHDAALDELMTLMAVRDLIDRQPYARRAVAVLYFLEEWEYREIAEALGITESTVRNQVARMRRLLKPFVHDDQSEEGGSG